MRNYLLLVLAVIAIWIAPASGLSSTLIQLTFEGGGGGISPDGNKIVMKENINGKWVSYIRDLSSNSIINLPDNIGDVIIRGGISYNGEYIVVSTPGLNSSESSIYKIDYFNKSIIGPLFTVNKWEGPMCDILCWSDPRMKICNDGFKVVFLNNIEGPFGFLTEEHIFSANYDGSNLIDLGISVYDNIPDISGDCNWIVFNSYNPIGSIGLCIISSNGSEINYLMEGRGPLLDYYANKVIFSCKENNIWGICMINADGAGYQRLISPARGGLISQNGEILVYLALDTNDTEIYRMKINTGAIEKITDNCCNDEIGNINFDGSMIAFLSKSSEQSFLYNAFLYLDGGETKKGSYVNVDLGWGVVMIYPHVFIDGRTRMELNDQGPALPPGFSPGSPQTYYHISTTAGYEGEVLLCITYDETAFGGEERLLHLLHSHGMLGDWQDITVILNTEENQICGLTSDLSDFTIAKGPEWPSYEPPPPSGPFLSSTDDDDSSCGSLPGSLGGGLGAGILLVTCLMALRRLRKTWSKK